ncbi:LuxR C-terminal-related transcriptional regulator [Pontibacter harenae]|uniref:LuxR C-terminal-related transcriptional regulator n=1 Tax=Pontibacter harenae TaxID=2894083 RepID=UPI0021057D7D|nr:LuxR C-terminal-related transcriptional regulator [Pontibacter harenae]
MQDQKEQKSLEKELKELKKQLQELQAKCAFYEQVVNQVPANIYISDLEEGVLWCNKTNEETLGYTLDEIKEMGGFEYLYQIVHPDDRKVPDNSVTHYQNFTGAEYGGLFRAKHKNENEYKWFMGWAKAFTKNEDGDVKDLLCVDVDMSPRMNTEDQLVQALKDNLRNKNRLLIQSLRKREIEILSLICKGYSTKTIAEKLFLSVHTVTTHRKNIQRKLGTANVADMVLLATEAGLG